jgi:hypothetical protein
VDLLAVEELLHQLISAAIHKPSRMAAHVHPEDEAGRNGEGRILADVVERRGLAHFDGSIGDGVGDLKRRHDLARAEPLNLEVAIRQVTYGVDERKRGTMQRIEIAAEAGRHAPTDFGRVLGDRRRCYQRGSCGKSRSQNLPASDRRALCD